ncbi:MAG: aldehyde dehydrogenase family protein [Thermoproteota archaeon]|nr:aldehyde dehydrogenase family protein [Thermoproteota archaeon]
MMTFENEHTFRKFMISKAEEEFHNRYSKAVTDIRSQFGKKYSMIIDGKEASSSKFFVHTSPTDTRITLGYFPCAKKAQVRQAIKSAKKCFTERWRITDYKYRIQVCRAAALKIADRKFELAAWISYENGKNRYEAIADVDEAIDFIKYYSDEMERNNGFTVDMKKAESNEESKSVMKPYGVWGVIAPFNFPAAILIGMSVGALITGNTVVLKPASDTPIIGYIFTEIMNEAGLPYGALNFITGSGDIIGREIAESRDVAGIVFTGSKEVGFKIHREYGSKLNPRPIIAEMGGKNPVVVTSNADIDKAVEGVLKAAFGYSGQKCSACSRLYIHSDIKDAFMEKLVQGAKNLRVDNPIEQNSFMGPLINSQAYEKYKKFCRIASRDGKILTGGVVKKDDDYRYGYYVEPTIVDGLPKNHRLFKEELFVPILCVAEYDKYSEVLNLCNDSEYGLTAGIYSNRKEEIDSFLNIMEAGVIYVNRYRSATTGAMVGCQPFGGWKSSGTTGKGTGGPYYLMQFLREQSQTICQ